MREVRIGVVSVSMKVVSVEERLRRVFADLEEAARENCDLVVLPEYFSFHRTTEGTTAHEKGEPSAFAEEIPSGELSVRVSEFAARARMNVLASIMEKGPSEKVYNAAVLFGRDGSVLGKYRKTHLPPEERENTLPGEEVEVLECDCCRLGVVICWDFHFVELTRVYELGGADLVCWPTMRHGPLETDIYLDLAGRASLHLMPFVCATYVWDEAHRNADPFGPCIVGNDGRFLAHSRSRVGLLCAKLDLDARRTSRRRWDLDEYVDRQKHLQQSRRPELYRRIVEA